MSASLRRILAALASLLFATLGLAVVATPAHAAASARSCAPAATATYTHTFVMSDGADNATATIVPSTQLCPGQTQQFSLVSYFAPSVAFNANQFVFDKDIKTMSATTTSLSFSVQVPPCYTQVDFVFGPVIPDLKVQLYGDKKVGSDSGLGHDSTGPHARFNGYGSANRGCTSPSAMSVPKCDGSGTILLSNSGLSNLYPTTYFNVSFHGVAQPQAQVGPGGSVSVFPGLDGWPAVITEQGTSFTNTFNWSWPTEQCGKPTLTVTPDCSNFMLNVSNPDLNHDVSATAIYGGASQTNLVKRGGTATFTFPAGAGAATITLAGDPAWGSLTETFTRGDSCFLADTGASVTTAVVAGASLAAAGAFLIYFVARHMGRRRRAA